MLFRSTNTLVITDYADNLQRLGKIIAALDQPSLTDFEVIPLKHAIASDLAVLVQRLADTSAAGAATAGAAAAAAGTSSGTVLADARSNSLIIRAPNAARLAMMRATIERLDRPNAAGGPAGNLWVVHLKNAEATRLATVLRAAFGGGAAAAAGATTTAAPLTQAPAGMTATPSPQATAPVSASAAPSTGALFKPTPDRKSTRLNSSH